MSNLKRYIREVCCTKQYMKKGQICISIPEDIKIMKNDCVTYDRIDNNGKSSFLVRHLETKIIQE